MNTFVQTDRRLRASKMSASEQAIAIDGIYEMGFELLEADRWLEAGDVFRAMLLLAPSDERAWMALAECHERLGQLDVAIELYSMGVLAVANAVRCRLALARALTERGDWQNVDSVLDEAESTAEKLDDETLIQLVRRERGGRS
jgi:tetratricopeptide (TPR) repeat protein